jgi:hypothetical protein
MPGSPNRADLEILLRIMEIYVSDPVRKARGLWRAMPDGLTFDELVERYPRGSDDYELFGTIMIFWETIGSLMKHGLLNEELAFDTFLDAPPWKKVEVAFLSLRKEEGKALEGENLEFAYRRSLKWMERNAPQAQRLGSKSIRRRPRSSPRSSRARV